MSTGPSDPTTPDKNPTGERDDFDPGDVGEAPGQEIDTDDHNIDPRDREDLTIPPPDPSEPDHEPEPATSPERLARDEAAE